MTHYVHGSVSTMFHTECVRHPSHLRWAGGPRSARVGGELCPGPHVGGGRDTAVSGHISRGGLLFAGSANGCYAHSTNLQRLYFASYEFRRK